MTKHIHIHLPGRRVGKTQDAGFDESKHKRDHGKFSATTGLGGAAHHEVMAKRHEAEIPKAKSDSERSIHMRGMNLHRKAAASGGNGDMIHRANSWSESVAKGTAQGPMSEAERNQRAAIKWAPNGPGSVVQGGVKPMAGPSGKLPDRVGPGGKDVGSAQNIQARIDAKKAAGIGTPKPNSSGVEVKHQPSGTTGPHQAKSQEDHHTDMMRQHGAASAASKPGPDGKPMGIHPALQAAANAAAGRTAPARHSSSMIPAAKK